MEKNKQEYSLVDNNNNSYSVQSMYWPDFSNLHHFSFNLLCTESCYAILLVINVILKLINSRYHKYKFLALCKNQFEYVLFLVVHKNVYK